MWIFILKFSLWGGQTSAPEVCKGKDKITCNFDYFCHYLAFFPLMHVVYRIYFPEKVFLVHNVQNHPAKILTFLGFLVV